MRSARTVLARVLVLLACAGAARAQGALLVVDAAGGPGSSFTSLADAVAAAADGDTLLVRSGAYAPFTIDGRTLIVVAAPGTSVVVDAELNPPTFSDPAITLRGLAPD